MVTMHRGNSESEPLPHDHGYAIMGFKTHIPWCVDTTTRISCCPTQDRCPVNIFAAYWTLRQKAVPIGSITALDAACRSHLTHRLAALAPRYAAAQLDSHPELMALAEYAGHDHQGISTAAAASSAQLHPQEMEASPVVACALPERLKGSEGSRTVDVIWASYDALHWLQHNAQAFTILGAAAH